MVKRTTLFALGILFGVVLDMVPHAFEVMARTNVCRESCPAPLRALSLGIYALMPIGWGIILAITTGNRHTGKIALTCAVFSLLLMSSLTWLLFAYQHPPVHP